MDLYSVKMRASKDELHISGAENIICAKKIDSVVAALVKRAMNHSKGSSNFINLKIEKIEAVEFLDPLKVTTINVENKEEGFRGIKKILELCGVKSDIVNCCVDTLCSIKDMRGAVILDIHTLERLEPDKKRGVRVTYMDLENRSADGLLKSQKYNTHFIEALVLATKVLKCPSIIAELCYSDDPDYTAGYVATKEMGYTRFDHLKEKGSEFGGRVFLFDSSKGSLEDCIYYLENEKIIVKDDIKINDSIDLDVLEGSGFRWMI